MQCANRGKAKNVNKSRKKRQENRGEGQWKHVIKASDLIQHYLAKKIQRNFANSHLAVDKCHGVFSCVFLLPVLR